MPSISDMRALGWGDPDDAGYRARHIITVTHAGVDLYVRTEAAPLFLELLRRLEMRGENLDAGQTDDWSYANRDIRGFAGHKSYHAWGLAIDLDALKNALGSRRHSWPSDIAQIAADCGLFWGGLFQNRPDPMHFEFQGSRAQALEVAARLLAPRPRPIPKPVEPQEDPVAKLPLLVPDSHGDDVRTLQGLLNARKFGVALDGDFGPKTTDAVRRFQKRRGLAVDGKVGRETWTELLGV